MVCSMATTLPPARAEFSTAEKTFDRWKKAMAEGNMEKMIDCYALMYQGFLASQMSSATGKFTCATSSAPATAGPPASPTCGRPTAT